MNSTTTEKEMLEAKSRRLRSVGRINLWLMLALIAGFLSAFFVSLSFSPNEDDGLHQVFDSLTRILLPLDLACLGLLLMWAPAWVICSFKLKRMNEATSA
jgi:hypothetical protein